jgi:hypothetical protein
LSMFSSSVTPSLPVKVELPKSASLWIFTSMSVEQKVCAAVPVRRILENNWCEACAIVLELV